MSIKKILILSSGGDAPGMNAATRAVVRTALAHNIEIFASEMGYSGLIDKNIYPLDASSVANCIQLGGTILKTGRCEKFHQVKVRQQCADYLSKENFDAMIVQGGDGSFRGASLLASISDIKVIGIPCTIDNDIHGTEYCIGFDTARNTALNAIDRIRDTAFSHERNFMIEVMGRASGFLAVDVGIAGGAEFVLIPEFPMTTEELIQKIQQKRRQKLTSIIVVAEADKPGHSLQLAKEIKKLSGEIYRVCILGHTQRGGTPTVMDRTTASVMGYQAVIALLNGETNKMTAMIDNKVTLVPFPDPKNATRFFNDRELLEMNKVICEIKK